jgi:23S rRNA (adenine2503-C2)-methyltransferase
MWENTKRLESTNENVWKYVFENKNAVAEAVLYKYPTFNERTVICCSTQSGCPIGCRFCGAGDYFVRSLTQDEIVAQVEHLFKDKEIVPTEVQKLQIMFMSMGEPLLNLKELDPAIRRLNKLYPQAKLLISTSAPNIGAEGFRALNKLSREVPTVGLQFSVHESTDEARNQLIPFKNKLTIEEIGFYGALWAIESDDAFDQRRKPFFNYCVHEKNSTVEDADRLLKAFPPHVWECTISVICERDEHVSAANERQRSLASGFMEKMLERGFNVRMFDPAGQDDIGGGCGQLWFVQDWMKKNPTLARPTIGKGLPVLHTPT